MARSPTSPPRGGRGLGKRVQAEIIHHKLTGSQFYSIPVEVNILSDGDVSKLIKSIRAVLDERDPVLIVFDTLARSMGGADENGAAEGNQVTSAANALRTTFNGACVLIIHHNGKDSARGMRGSSTYRNNADTVIQVKAPTLQEGQRRLPGSPVTLHSVKAKEADNFGDFAFTAEHVKWATEEGEFRDSLVICASDAQPQAQPGHDLKDSERTALLALQPDADSNTTEWLVASKLADRTFYDARDALLAKAYAEQVQHEGDSRRKWNRLSAIGAELRNRCG